MSNLLTQSQVEDLARSVGFTAANARIMAAICMCEAPYNTGGKAYSNAAAIGDQALANETWGYSYGLAQVRSLRSQKGTGGFRDELRLPDPEFNLRSARTIKLAAGSFNPWSTYTGGQYRAYLQDLFPPPPGSYVVVSGDTLSGIAAKISGGAWTWEDLAAANGLVKPWTIHIGDLLLLPFYKTGA